MRLAELGAKGEAPYGRFANGRGGRARGVPFVTAPASASPGREKVTILVACEKQQVIMDGDGNAMKELMVGAFADSEKDQGCLGVVESFLQPKPPEDLVRK